MAPTNRTTTHALDVLDALTDAPYEHDFFQALRALECAFECQPRLGESIRAKDDAIRLGQTPSLAFAPASLSKFERAAKGGPHRMEVFFFGLLGPGGPLPLHLTEYARARIRDRNDETFVRFLDIFHHRMLSFFYRAWANSQPTVHFDRPHSDGFVNYVGSQIGIGQPSLQNRDALPDATKRFFAGHFACHLRHSDGLANIIAHFFSVPARIREFSGGWLDIPREERWHLNAMDTRGLGVGTTLGSRVWQCQHRFQVEIGPLSLRDFREFLPGKLALTHLAAIVKNYVGIAYVWDVRLILRHAEVPSTEVGREATSLGRTTWLGHRRVATDAADVTIRATHLATL